MKNETLARRKESLAKYNRTVIELQYAMQEVVEDHEGVANPRREVMECAVRLTLDLVLHVPSLKRIQNASEKTLLKHVYTSAGISDLRHSLDVAIRRGLIERK